MLHFDVPVNRCVVCSRTPAVAHTVARAKDVGGKMHRPAPSFSFPLPASGTYPAAQRLAEERGYLCERFSDYGEERVGLWEKWDSH